MSPRLYGTVQNYVIYMFNLKNQCEREIYLSSSDISPLNSVCIAYNMTNVYKKRFGTPCSRTTEKMYA